MKFSFLIIVIFLFNLGLFTIAQTDSSYLKTEDLIESVIEDALEETDNSDLFDSFEHLIANPIDINTADITELLRIPFIDVNSANLIIAHRKKFGSYFSINELYSIRDIPKEVTDKIVPFVTLTRKQFIQEPSKQVVSVKRFIDEIKVELRTRTIQDFQERKGFADNKYAGSNTKMYNRLLVKQGSNYQLGILAEKDAGETSLNDFTSFHLLVKDISLLKTLALGDYILEFGQGVALWGTYDVTKSTDAIYPAKKNARGIRAYTSSTEVEFLRGGATAIEYNDFKLSAFYSYNYFDANIDTISNIITSRPIDGFHRTAGELFRKDLGLEKLFGGALEYKIANRIKLGYLAYQAEINFPIEPTTTYGISGDSFFYNSAFYDAVFSNINLFGEFSYDGTSVASINGLNISVSRNFSLVTAFRNYPKNYVNYKGSGFGERAGATSNETGFYTGFRWRTEIGLLNFYYDQFKYPYRTFTDVSPSQGDEFLAELSSKPYRSAETKIRYKYENKEVTQTIDDLKQLTKRLRQSIRAEVAFYPVKSIRLKTRVEYNYFRINHLNQKEDGTLLFQDIRYTPTNNLNIYGRVIFFRTDSFNSAIYEYENDLTGVLTNLAMYGEGMRWYFVLRYRPIKLFTLSLKYSETFKPKEKTLSSGNNLINNNIDNRISLQLDFNY